MKITSYHTTLPDLKEPYKPKAKESAVLHACITWLYHNGMQPIRNNTGGFVKEYTSKKTGKKHKHYVRFGKIGAGDIVCCARTGRWLEVEAKGTDGDQGDEQIARQRHIEGMGGIYILARSVDDLIARKFDILGVV